MNPTSILVTGSNRGIGLEMIRQIVKLPQPPKYLFAACRNPDQAQDLNKIAESNSNVKVLKLEVTDSTDIQSAVDTVGKEVGDNGLNLLINNAGYLKRNGLDDVNVDDMMQHFRINSVAPLMVSKAFLPLLRKAATKSSIEGMSASKSAIINISTKVASLDDNSMGGNYSYRASKTALNMISKNLSIDLKPEGILVTMIHPGWVQTNMGGPKALITAEQSVSNMLKTIGQLNEEKTAAFLNHDGKPIMW